LVATNSDQWVERHPVRSYRNIPPSIYFNPQPYSTAHFLLHLSFISLKAEISTYPSQHAEFQPLALPGSPTYATRSRSQSCAVHAHEVVQIGQRGAVILKLALDVADTYRQEIPQNERGWPVKPSAYCHNTTHQNGPQFTMRIQCVSIPQTNQVVFGTPMRLCTHMFAARSACGP
jgi:hypothetical protein